MRLDYQPDLSVILDLTRLVSGGEDRQLSPKVPLDGAPVPLFEVFPLDGRAVSSAPLSGVCAFTSSGSASKQAHPS